MRRTQDGINPVFAGVGHLTPKERPTAKFAKMRDCGTSALRRYPLPTTTFDALGKTHPTIKLVLLENLLRNVARMLTRLNQEITTLAR